VKSGAGGRVVALAAENAADVTGGAAEPDELDELKNDIAMVMAELRAPGSTTTYAGIDKQTLGGILRELRTKENLLLGSKTSTQTASARDPAAIRTRLLNGGAIFGVDLQGFKDSRVREALLLVAVACEVANLAGRDLKTTPLPVTYSMTSETFGDSGYSLAGSLARVSDYVFDVKISASWRAQLALVYAVAGYGKTFFAQTLYRKLREKDNDVIPLLVTFNDHSKIGKGEEDIGMALALRLAFFALVDHRAYGYTASSDASENARVLSFEGFCTAFYETLESLMNDYEGDKLAKDLMRGLDVATNERMTFAFIVDDTAQIDRAAYPSFARCMKGVADCLQPASVDEFGRRRGRVASIIVGTTLASWRRAGFQGWKDEMHTSPRPPSRWLALPGARPAFSDLRPIFVDRVTKCLQMMQIQADQVRIQNLASILLGYASGHWRTCEEIALGLAAVPTDPRMQGSCLDNGDLDSRILGVALEQATDTWKALSKHGDKTWETAFTTLLAASVLGKPLNPQATLPVPGAQDFRLIADWREDCIDLVPLQDDDYDIHVPEFSLVQLRNYAESVLKLEAVDEPECDPVTLVFAKHVWALLGGGDFRNVAIAPSWQRWEFDLAHIVRLKFVSFYLWRCLMSRREWPRSRLWNTWCRPNVAKLASDGRNCVKLREFLRGFEFVGTLGGAKLQLSAKVNEALDSDLWRSNKTTIVGRWPVEKASNGKVLKWGKTEMIGDRADIETYFTPAQDSPYDQSVRLSRDWQPGDVLIPGENNPGFDVMIFVRFAADKTQEERNGLILFQAQLGSVEATTTLNEEKLDNTVEKCAKNGGVLFGDHANWMDFPVKEEDVVVVCASHCPCAINRGNVETSLKKHGARFSVAFAGLDAKSSLDADAGVAKFVGKTFAARVAARPDFLKNSAK